MSETRNVSIAAAQILRHVVSGGYLGASWPMYVRHMPRRMTAGELDRAYRLAERRSNAAGWNLASVAQHNAVESFLEISDYEVQP